MEQEKDTPESEEYSVEDLEVQSAAEDADNQDAGDDAAEDADNQDAGDDPESDMDDASPEKLHLMLEDARAKADEHWEQVIRARAELENLKKRHSRELENAHKYAIDKFVNEILPVKDSLELGLNAASDEGADLAKLIEGTELTLKLFADVMGKFGIEEINPVGEAFNPEFHQAMAMQPSDEAAPNTVLTVVQKGYTLNERLVRPAMVMVAQAPN
ncbi:MAG: nucleotide exchange factor GrpE [Gammaproteobacteria bacterium]